VTEQRVRHRIQISGLNSTQLNLDKYWMAGGSICTTATITKLILTHHSSLCISARTMLLVPSTWQAIGPVYNNTNNHHCFPAAFNSVSCTKNATCKTPAYYCKQ